MTDGDVDFGRDGSARNVGAFPGRYLRCAEERGKWVFLRARVPCVRKTVIPRTNINCCILNYDCVITRLKCQLSGDVLHMYECY